MFMTHHGLQGKAVALRRAMSQLTAQPRRYSSIRRHFVNG